MSSNDPTRLRGSARRRSGPYLLGQFSDEALIGIARQKTEAGVKEVVGEVLVIKRNLCGHFEPLTWHPVLLDSRLTAELACNHGHSGLLSDHDIAEDGTVSPSVVCTSPGCGFHESVKLDGWEERNL
mgnify:CR=1 FL=1